MKLSNLLTALEITADDCVEEIQNLKREIFPRHPRNNLLPLVSVTADGRELVNDSCANVMKGHLVNITELLRSKIKDDNTVLLERLKDNNNLLQQLKAENVVLKQSYQQSLEQIGQFRRECNQSRLITALNETMKSTMNFVLGTIFNDIHHKSMQAGALINGIQNFTGRLSNALPEQPRASNPNSRFLRPCSGKSIQLEFFNLTSKLTTHFQRAPNGTVCIGGARNTSSQDNFLVFNKNASSLRFQGTQSLHSSFVLFTPYSDLTITITDGNINSCLTGTSRIPSELRGTSSHSNVQFSRTEFKRDCFWIGWLVDDYGSVVDTGLTVNLTLWY